MSREREFDDYEDLEDEIDIRRPARRGDIPTYLTQAILVTLFCCLPFGIVAIVQAAQVNSKLDSGDVRGAQAASDKARLWSWIAFGVGIPAQILVVYLQLMMDRNPAFR
jgi:hypothetical protein